MDPLASISKQIQARYGIDASILGRVALTSATEHRMRVIGIGSFDDYLEHLKAESEELDHLAEWIVVPETWFFRDSAPFEYLATWVQEIWLPRHQTGKVNILAIPCSTGEEAYSVAIALLGSCVPGDRFEILGAEVSRRALNAATAANYTRRSFRSDIPLRYRKYLAEEGTRVQVTPEAARTVRFVYGNILGEMPGDGRRFDILLCRNLLIYFDAPTQHQVIDTLRQWLRPEGLLIAGHAEALLFLNRGFTRCGPAAAFALQPAETHGRTERGRTSASSTEARNRAASKRPDSANAGRRESQPRLGSSRHRDGHGRNAGPGWSSHVAGASSSGSRPDVTPALAQTDGQGSSGNSTNVIERARAFADAGQTVQAAELCNRVILAGSTDPEVYALLGLIRETEGKNSEATHHYRRALYLNPDHYESLVHLALMARREGDSRTADLLIKRADKLWQALPATDYRGPDTRAKSSS
jgi:chemotaxis protein methyltransferase WspC